MNSDLPRHRRAGFERSLLVGLAVVAVVLQCFPDLGEALQWRRSGDFLAPVWTAITGHLTHWTWDHLIWDVVAFVALGLAAIRILPGRLLCTLGLAGFLIPLEVALLRPEFVTYRGLSGIDSALFGWLLAGLWQQGGRSRGLALVGLLGFAGKSLFEILTGSTLFVSHSEDFVPVGSAHVVGLLCGMLAGNSKLRILIRFFRRPPVESTPGSANRSRS